MMTSQVLDTLPMWAVFLGLLAVFFVSMKSGAQFGRWRRERLTARGAEAASVGGLESGAMLPLLGFLLAVTFGAAGSHGNDRRALVIEDVNAIGTTFLRADLLAEPQRSTIRQLLGDYVERRHLVEGEDYAVFKARAPEFHDRIWREAKAAVASANTPVTAQFIVALNAMIDVHGVRAGREKAMRVPPMNFVMLAFLSVLAMVMTGYAQGLSGRRFPIANGALVIGYATVFMLVIDLDRPAQGFFFVSQEPMIELRNSTRAALADASPS